jgi:hypothetical protein
MSENYTRYIKYHISHRRPILKRKRISETGTVSINQIHTKKHVILTEMLCGILSCQVTLLCETGVNGAAGATSIQRTNKLTD